MKILRSTILIVLLIAVVLGTIATASTTTKVYAQAGCFPYIPARPCTAAVRCVTCAPAKLLRQCLAGTKYRCNDGTEYCQGGVPYWAPCRNAQCASCPK
jgi:hypothetical protein